MPRSAAPLFIALSLSTHVLSAGEIRITGQGFEIQDGSAVPSVTRGTQFGDFPVGATQLTRTFVIHNDGGTPLQLNSISENSAHFQLGTVPNPGPIAAGASKSFDLAFNPSSPGVKTATVTVGSDDADEGTYTFVVEGTGLGTPQIEIRGREGAASPWLAITKNATSGSANRGTIFPDTPVNGGLTTSTFQLRNDGDDTLAVSSITSDGADFAVAGVPSSVAAGATETFTIAFNPSAVGNREATVTVRSDDPDDDPFTFTVEGVGLADGPKLAVRGGPDVDLLYNVTYEWGGPFGNNAVVTATPLDCDPAEGRPITNGDTTPSVLDGTNFGTITVGTQQAQPAGSAPPPAPDHYFRLINNGDTDLTVTGVSLSTHTFATAHSAWAPPIAGTTLPPGGCATLPIEFVGTSVGPTTCTVAITSTDPDHPLFTFDVKAEPQPLTPPLGETFPPVLRLLSQRADRPLRNGGDEVEFGSITSSGNSRTIAFRVVNAGSSTLDVASISSDSSHFTVDADLVPSLQSGESFDFDITFAPTATGELNGTITIISDDPSAPEFTFDATGVAGSGGDPPAPRPELVVFGGDPMVRLLRDDDKPDTADGTHAGGFAVGDEIVFAFRARNRGDAPLTFTRAFAPGTPIVIDDLQTTLAPGEHDDFTLRFDARNPGDYTLLVALQSDDPAGEYRFAIGATVTESATEPSAGIEILGFTLLDGHAYLNFNTPAGATYRVVTNTDLGEDWNLVEGGIPGGGFWSTFIFDGGASERRFFRVEEE